MQIIKFRGKTKSGKLVYGDLIRLPKNINMCHIEKPSKEINTAICDITNPMRSPVYVLPESVGQFIGRKDKNGKEIYAGDKTNYGVVVWFDCLTWDCGGGNHSGFYLKDYSLINEKECELDWHNGFNDDIEVIEVCDNPEIMGAKNAG